MTDATLAEGLAAFAEDTTFDSLPADVVGGVRARVLDVLGLCCAGGRTDAATAVRAWVRENEGAGRATAIGIDHDVPAANAAFLNGVLAHALDYDDTHLPSIVHPSASVVPAVLAAAEESGADGAAIVEGTAVGLEICVRLGMAGFDVDAGNSVFFEHGQHATAICGTVAAAAAVAKVTGGTRDDVLAAMGIAASQASGIIEANRTGGTVKQLHCGWSAHSGVVAARLARLGITGPPTVFEGRFGLFEAFLHRPPLGDDLHDGLGSHWRLREIHVKPYPTNHFAQAGVDAALRLRANGVRPDDVEAMELGVATPTVRTIGEPLDTKRRPASGYAAKFSGPFTLATALRGGAGLGVGHEDFTDDAVDDTEIVSLADRITVVADPWCDERYPWALPARVTVHTRDGTQHTEEITANRGGPDRPLTSAELTRKFTDNVAGALAEADADAIADWCQNLSRGSDGGTALALLRKAQV